ncbi:hypothetical protein H7J06_26565 [Mycobacterium hodleri]|uniref:hypothetical protein n=1 Tax=Mycolicibacterium hodleri TaxID=49897 RepID=UPI0021F37A4B|nr:hypothetical protein [Mycolicibacterium hodleri]MCV7136536.1 hypothetical protein [Mycolicibacterium hodleri]
MKIKDWALSPADENVSVHDRSPTEPASRDAHQRLHGNHDTLDGTAARVSATARKGVERMF